MLSSKKYAKLLSSTFHPYTRALPGRRRGAGLGDTFNGTANNVIGGFLGKPRSAGISTDPAVGRRIDGLENKIQGQDQSQRNIMDQMMKLSQELKVSVVTSDFIATVVCKKVHKI